MGTFWMPSNPVPLIDKSLHIMSYLRFLLYFPRLRNWIQLRSLYRSIRNQPTPQLLHQRLREVRAWEQPGAQFLNGCFYLWMLLVPSLILCSTTETEFSRLLWTHWKLHAVWWLIVSRIGMVLFLMWLQSSSFINRGVS